MLLPYNVVVMDKYLKDRISLLPWIGVQLFVLAYWLPFLPYVLGFHEGYQADKSIAMVDNSSLIDVMKLFGKLIIGKWIDYGQIFKIIYYVYMVGIFVMAAVTALGYRKSMFSRFTVGWIILPLAAMVLLPAIRSNYHVLDSKEFAQIHLYLFTAKAQSSRRALLSAQQRLHLL